MIIQLNNTHSIHRFMQTIVVILTITCFSIPNTTAKIVAVTHMAAVERIIMQHKDKNMFVAFDVDMTLIVPKNPAVYAVYYPYQKKYESTLEKIFKNLTVTRKAQIRTFGIQSSPQRLVEQDTRKIIQTLQKKGVKMIGFTTTVKRSLTIDAKKWEAWKFDALSKLGIDFSKAFPQQKIVFNEVTPQYYHYPVYYKGILFANGIDKGKMIAPFFKHMKLKPSIFIMVDDRKSNLVSIETAIAKFDPSIQFIGIEYGGC